MRRQTRTRNQLLAVAILVLATTIALATAQRSAVAGQIDLTGDWTITTDGDVALMCTAAVEQNGTHVRADLDCPGVPTSPFSPTTPLKGSFNPQTRFLDLDLDGELGLDIDLSGMVSEDGSSVDGEWNWSYRLFGTFHAVRGSEPPQLPDIRGVWSIETGAMSPQACDGTVEQDAAVVEMTLDCSGEPSVVLSGALEGRRLALAGGPYTNLTVTVSEDGLALGGYWFGNISGFDTGSFTGLKQIDRSFAGNATGDWRIVLTSTLVGFCDAAVADDGEQVFAAFECGPPGGYWLRGAIDDATGTFLLEGIAGDLGDYYARLRGVMSEDGHSFTGTFAATSMESGESFGGTLTGSQIDGSPSLMDIDGQYGVTLVSDIGEHVACSLDIMEELEVLTVAVDCAGAGAATLDGTINPLTGDLAFGGELGSVDIEFDGTALGDGKEFILDGEWTSSVRFANGCFTTRPQSDCTDATRPGPGDTDCSGRIDAIDATVVLQYVAGLIDGGSEALRCAGFVADLASPFGALNASDAAVILQIGAGLVGRLAG